MSDAQINNGACGSSDVYNRTFKLFGWEHKMFCLLERCMAFSTFHKLTDILICILHTNDRVITWQMLSQRFCWSPYYEYYPEKVKVSHLMNNNQLVATIYTWTALFHNWDPLYWQGITLIPAWISNYIMYKVLSAIIIECMITYPKCATSLLSALVSRQ